MYYAPVKLYLYHVSKKYLTLKLNLKSSQTSHPIHTVVNMG